MDELQAGVEQPLAVLPQPPILLQPGKAALDDPALGHDLEGVQLASLGNLYRDVPTHNLLHTLRKGLARVAAVAQHALHSTQGGLAALECLQRPFAIRHLGRGHGYCVRQPLGVHRNVTLDARDLLARVIALQARRVRVLHALRIDDQERAAGVAPPSLSGRANLIFLKPAPAGCHPRVARSRSQSTSARCATWESRWAVRATGSLCAADTAPHTLTPSGLWRRCLLLRRKY